MAERFKTPSDAIRLGSRMRRSRRSRGLTIVQLSKLTGVDPGQISKLERGQMATMSPNVQKICISLGLSTTPTSGERAGLSSVGERIDALLAGSAISEQALARLIAAIEEVLLEASSLR
ncbi:helix-turn-helix domain-containing protein [Xanthomonas vasicola]|uniref:helix-turn-helix domain-containing protein n=1 Tax=Xanthomonas vasicola TaxID=56459 RepID=UPI0009B82ABF|nr:helix-turn-helix transcriptional regulator [Xanthomonas vasicola]AZR35201.1 XRE family transcriptional regulator [Xanthomonas vasicola]AZR36460.1 XRE family transcriptional regulator [Xanthomonas vasicola]